MGRFFFFFLSWICFVIVNRWTDVCIIYLFFLVGRLSRNTLFVVCMYTLEVCVSERDSAWLPAVGRSPSGTERARFRLRKAPSSETSALLRKLLPESATNQYRARCLPLSPTTRVPSVSHTDKQYPAWFISNLNSPTTIILTSINFLSTPRS